MSIHSQLASGRKTAHFIRIACTILLLLTLACTMIPVILPIVSIIKESQSTVQGSIAQVIAISVVNLIYLSVTLIASTVLLIQILKTVEKGEPFAKANAIRLRWVGIIIMAGSLIKFAAIAIIAQSAGIDGISGGAQAAVLSDIYHGVVNGISAFIPGLFVLVVSFVFAYGAKLQREHDQTV